MGRVEQGLACRSAIAAKALDAGAGKREHYLPEIDLPHHIALVCGDVDVARAVHRQARRAEKVRLTCTPRCGSPACDGRFDCMLDQSPEASDEIE